MEDEAIRWINGKPEIIKNFSTNEIIEENE